MRLKTRFMTGSPSKKHKILVTGAAGFVGFHLTQRLLAEGHTVVGLDNLNDYYDVRLKEARLAQIGDHPRFEFVKMDLAYREGMQRVFLSERFDRVVHLAAQAGVRYSIENPNAYVDGNLVGFVNILEGCRHNDVEHLVYASSSSVYGANEKQPFAETDQVDHPISLYAATKKANELIAHTYAHLYGLPTTGLRFFTVYGPWGRPDMAYFLFTKAIFEGKPIRIFNHGKMQRDFTYINDIVEGVSRVIEAPPEAGEQPGTSAPYAIYNIGNNQPVELMSFVEAIEAATGTEAVKEYHPMQPGDVPITYADVSRLQEAVGYHPNTSIDKGIGEFVDWYREYYGV